MYTPINAKRLAQALMKVDPQAFKGYSEDLNSVDLEQIGNFFAGCDPEFARELEEGIK
jgi:hypothetical protein